MFIVFLKFTDKKHLAKEFMQDHLTWLKSGIEDGIFLMAGKLGNGNGGSIIAHNTTENSLIERLNLDPFVIEKIVTIEVHQVSVNFTQSSIAFLQA